MLQHVLANPVPLFTLGQSVLFFCVPHFGHDIIWLSLASLFCSPSLALFIAEGVLYITFFLQGLQTLFGFPLLW
jgi:hypothetical protein